MLFVATRLRAAGRVLSKYLRDRAWVRGELQVAEAFDKELHRVVRVARLLEPGKQADVFPPLHDVQLVAAMPHGQWTMTGFERVDAIAGHPDDLVAYQQSWCLEPVDPSRRDQPQVG